MYITKRYLKKIINEELQILLKEQVGDDPADRESTIDPLPEPASFEAPRIAPPEGVDPYSEDYRKELAQHFMDNEDMDEESALYHVNELDPGTSKQGFKYLAGVSDSDDKSLQYQPGEDYVHTWARIQKHRQQQQQAKQQQQQAKQQQQQAKQQQYALEAGVDPAPIDPKTGLDFTMEMGMPPDTKPHGGAEVALPVHILPDHVKKFKFKKTWYFHNQKTGRIYKMPAGMRG